MENNNGIRHPSASGIKPNTINRDGTETVIQTWQTVYVTFDLFTMSICVLADLVPAIFVRYQTCSGRAVEDPARPRCVEDSIVNIAHVGWLFAPAKGIDIENGSEAHTPQLHVRRVFRQPYQVDVHLCITSGFT